MYAPGIRTLSVAGVREGHVLAVVALGSFPRVRHSDSLELCGGFEFKVSRIEFRVQAFNGWECITQGTCLMLFCVFTYGDDFLLLTQHPIQVFYNYAPSCCFDFSSAVYTPGSANPKPPPNPECEVAAFGVRAFKLNSWSYSPKP